MRAGELAVCRGQLGAFAGEVFAPLVRRDQREKGALYLRGLLLDGPGNEMTAHGEAAEPHQPAYGGLGPRPLPSYRNRPVSLREHVLAAGRGQGRALTWRKGSKAAMSSHFVLVRVRLAGRRPKPAADGAVTTQPSGA